MQILKPGNVAVHLLISLFFCGMLAQLATAQTKSTINFSFTLPTAARTSAGVFAKDSTLLRTLWSGVEYPAGVHQQSWDGLDDNGRLVSAGTYDIRLLSNTVSYTWEGVIGNSSYGVSQGNNLQRGFLRIHGMAISGNTAYYGVGYAEGNPSQAKFLTSNPQARLEFSPKGSTDQATQFVATDGSSVYWAGYDGMGNGNSWFVFGTNTSDDKEKSFPQGTAVKTTLGKTYASCLDVIQQADGVITGLAVQKSGNLLFVAHKKMHQIRVFHKTSGALLQSLFFNDAAALAVDPQDNLWVVNGNTLKKYSPTPDGKLSDTNISLSGLDTPMALAIAPDNATLLVADGGNSQQLKAYNPATGQPLWTLGQPGGYRSDPSVGNDKFYFSDVSGSINNTFVAYQPDGSFWVGDSGNYRAQHYGPGRNWLDRIMYLQNNYSTYLDQTNPRRLLAQHLEFALDYSKPLGANNGSWTLVKNWRASLPAAYFPNISLNGVYLTSIFRDVLTMPNGRVYAWLRRFSDNKWVLVELPPSGPLRLTKIAFDAQNRFTYHITPDGQLKQSANNYSGTSGTIDWQNRPLLGFDADNDPLWGPPQAYAQAPVRTGGEPVSWYGGDERTGQTTASGVLVSFDPGKVSGAMGGGYHLGGLRAGSQQWLWQTAHATSVAYQGAYPSDGAYDVGNHVEYAGGGVSVLDRHIFWNYHGEFWKNSQVNKWQHVYDNGLLVGVFGQTGVEAVQSSVGGGPVAGMGGNVLGGTVVRGTDGVVYLYHGEEAGWSGVHRWRIDGLNSIQEQVIPVSVSRTRPHSLLGTYTESKDLNIANTRLVQLDNVINFNWDRIPFKTTTPNASVFSARWTGFIEPAHSENYTFYVTADKGVRLWVDNKLIIDQLSGNSLTDYTGDISLESHKQYPIRLESFGGKRLTLSWSSASQPKQIVDTKYLYPAPDKEVASGIDLLDGLTSDNILTNDLYGWKRSSGEDYSDLLSKYWTAKTRVKTYDRFTSPDLYVYFRQNKAIHTITRSLGESIDQRVGWRLTGSINQDGNFFSIDEGRTRNGGSFIEILDDADKVITRINHQVTLSPTPVGRIYGNDKLIAQGDYFNVITPIFTKSQPLDIVMANGNAVIKYGPFAPITAPLADLTANWHKPRTLRLYFWGNGYNASRIIDIERMRFFPADSSTFILVSANDEQNTLEASSPSGYAGILVSENGGPYVPYTQTIQVGDVVRPEGYWQFKLDLPPASEPTEVTNSPAFTTSEDTRFSVYPNPTKGILNIKHPLVEGDCVLEMFSIDGKKMSSWIPSTGTITTTVDVTTYPSGVYILQFRKNATTCTTRFVR